MAQRIIFPQPRQIELQQAPSVPLKPGQVRVQAVCSLISIGTELTMLRKAFDPGTHWDRVVSYPCHPGYCFVGRVTEVAPGVNAPTVGARVGLVKTHCSEHVIDAAECILIPDGVPDRVAAWATLAKIAAMGARAARHGLGDSVLIIGAGPIGQMSIRWAVAAGCEHVVVIDTIAGRLEHARRGGATGTIAETAGRARDQVIAMCSGRLPGFVIDTTGNAAVLPEALSLAADRGRVIAVGDPGSPASQHLTPDIITRGVSITGVHGTHTDGGWDFARVAGIYHEMVLDGRFRIDDSINTHTFAPAQAAEAYRVAEHDRATAMGIIFDWA
jgi:2-desacetyl-2-hydroxyethyl bacteriochlorophyllide A dehydrogenase